MGKKLSHKGKCRYTYKSICKRNIKFYKLQMTTKFLPKAVWQQRWGSRYFNFSFYLLVKKKNYKLQILIEFAPEVIRQLVQRQSDAWVCSSRGRDAGPQLDAENLESVTPTTRSERKQKWPLITLTEWKH